MINSEKQAEPETNIKFHEDAKVAVENAADTCLATTLHSEVPEKENAFQTTTEDLPWASHSLGMPDQSDKSTRTLTTNDHIFVNITQPEEFAQSASGCYSADSTQMEQLDDVSDPPEIQLGDPTLSMVNEFIDNEALEKQKKAKEKGVCASIWCILTCGM